MFTVHLITKKDTMTMLESHYRIQPYFQPSTSVQKLFFLVFLLAFAAAQIFFISLVISEGSLPGGQTHC